MRAFGKLNAGALLCQSMFSFLIKTLVALCSRVEDEDVGEDASETKRSKLPSCRKR